MEGKHIRIPPEYLKELVVGHKVHRSVGDFRLSEADIVKARRELKETEEARKTSLQQLKKLLTQNEDIQYRLDDAYLLCFLRYNKFDCQRTHKILQKFYNLRNTIPDVFITPINIEAMLNTNIVNLMPYTTEDGCPIFIHKLGNWNTDEMNMLEVQTLFCIAADVSSMFPHMQINGILDIFDFGGMTARHFSKVMNPSSILLTAKLFQDLYPFRLKRILLFNCNALLYATWASIRYLFKKKLTDRLKFLRYDISEIHEYINPALLPKDYGGNLENEECYSYLKMVVLHNKEYLKYEQSFIKKKTSHSYFF